MSDPSTIPKAAQQAIQRPCDTCKSRKVRCIRPEHLPTTSTSGAHDPCEACKRRGDACTFEVAPKKRGPMARPLRHQQVVPRLLAPLRPKDDDAKRSLVEIDPFASIIPRDLLQHAISVYFRYVYGLVPLVHRPSFLFDIENHREHRADEEEWTILALSVAGMTMAHVPWAFSNLSKKEIREQVQKVHHRVKSFIFKDFETPSFGRCKLSSCSVTVSTNCRSDILLRGDHGDSTWTSWYKRDLPRCELEIHLPDGDASRIGKLADRVETHV